MRFLPPSSHAASKSRLLMASKYAVTVASGPVSSVVAPSVAVSVAVSSVVVSSVAVSSVVPSPYGSSPYVPPS
ncbi:hypothetical protein [Streptomyces tendae]|uniref:hypothetical protein n=1 Tax=Streptomyces tendae TaxID=1932 RepID=UPI003698BB9A